MSSTPEAWVEALSQLRSAGWRYDQIGPAVGSSARSVRRWDRLRVRLQQGGHPEPSLESAPLGTFAEALVRLEREHTANLARPEVPLPETSGQAAC